MKKTKELFNSRNIHKKQIEFLKRSKVDVKVGEFWWYYDGVNVGNEISKDGNFRRVCLVLKTNTGNGLLLILPLTTKYHKRLKEFYFPIHSYEQFKGLKESRGILNQIKFIDQKRIVHKVCNKRFKNRVVRKCILKYISLLQKNLS